MLVGALALIGVIVAIGWVRDLIPGFGNPFGTETVDRTGPAVLKSIRNLEDFRAASGHFEVIVDVEKDTRFVPASQASASSSSQSAPSRRASTSRIWTRTRSTSPPRRSVSLELPPATFREPELDLDRSYVYDRDRGAIDRIQSLLGDDTGADPELYVLAEEKLAAAARDGSGLLARAEANTRAMLEGLLRALGFTRVEIRFSRRL